MKIVIAQSVRHYVVDLVDRVGGTFAESVLGGMTASGLSTITGHGASWALILNTAAYAALYALVKAIAGGLNPKSNGAALLPGTMPEAKAVPMMTVTSVAGAGSGGGVAKVSGADG